MDPLLPLLSGEISILQDNEHTFGLDEIYEVTVGEGSNIQKVALPKETIRCQDPVEQNEGVDVNEIQIQGNTILGDGGMDGFQAFRTQ